MEWILREGGKVSIQEPVTAESLKDSKAGMKSKMNTQVGMSGRERLMKDVRDIRSVMSRAEKSGIGHHGNGLKPCLNGACSVDVTVSPHLGQALEAVHGPFHSGVGGGAALKFGL